ncbi:MAG: NDP-sugar synthase [Oscillospiraceae bacterium]
MHTSLVIMAAGIGSRFGGGIKQLKAVGPNGELIIDYSVHDAVEAGFDKIIFIIRHDIEEDFRNIIGKRIEKDCQRLGVKVCYAFQSLDDVPNGIKVPSGRIKPWGTGQAVLTCKELINEPFAVINADDYYGKEAFSKIHGFLENYDKNVPDLLCMAGFVLKNTLSENGAVTRGICKVNNEGFLTDIVETHNIVKIGNEAYADDKPVDINSHVSMNMWGFTPEFIGRLEDGFAEFFENIENETKSEYLIPIFIGKLLRKNAITVKVLEISEKWFGITYKEDVPLVQKEFERLIEIGFYKDRLFEDEIAALDVT